MLKALRGRARVCRLVCRLALGLCMGACVAPVDGEISTSSKRRAQSKKIGAGGPFFLFLTAPEFSEDIRHDRLHGVYHAPPCRRLPAVAVARSNTR